MAVAASISISGLQPVLDRLAGLEERLARPEPALEVVADLLEAHVARTFGTQGRWLGAGWAPLAASTVKARARRWGTYRQAPTGGAGPTGPILVWTGRLRGSFQRGSSEHVRLVSSSSLTWGSSVPYGRYHQAGGARLPRRAMLAFRDDWQLRELVFQPLRLWLQGVPAGAIKTVMLPRLGLGLGLSG